jgi:hypothetical protein
MREADASRPPHSVIHGGSYVIPPLEQVPPSPPAEENVFDDQERELLKTLWPYAIESIMTEGARPRSRPSLKARFPRRESSRRTRGQQGWIAESG